VYFGLESEIFFKENFIYPESVIGIYIYAMEPRQHDHPPDGNCLAAC